ncbi:ABC transporter ATP-binding protein [Flavobacterium sp.]|uniref:ABC transporter ATP-binding protein n=1 Tax=Flavobacterium sp. TaxID=239 RepID=UPI002C8E81AB|nr:ABC transporter ATP-binding protein [Flavobacterium sp.]HSD07727.1 ABC transporter ATP-binding protein [Flavobacterium sp.]
MNVVSVKQINKSYAKHKALDNISFEVKSGELFGIIGPDGAGKTTLFRILTTLLLPDSGEVSVVGLDVVKNFREIRNHVGYMPGRFSLYQDLTVEENLNFFATVFNTTIEENYHLIEDIYKQIEPFKDRCAGALSGGMKQKLALSCALIHKPSVLFLDEPTTGVDPVSRKEFWEMLKRLQKQGIAILVSTPYMDEATLCDRIALITEGKILKIETPENIIKQFDNILWAVQSNDMHTLLNDVRSNKNVLTCFAFGESLHVTISNENYSMNELKKFLEEKGHKEIYIEAIEATIEDCFMDLGNDSNKTMKA